MNCDERDIIITESINELYYLDITATIIWANFIQIPIIYVFRVNAVFIDGVERNIRDIVLFINFRMQ